MTIATSGDPVAIFRLAKRTEHVGGIVLRDFEAQKLRPSPDKSYRNVGRPKFPVTDNPVSQDLARSLTAVGVDEGAHEGRS